MIATNVFSINTRRRDYTFIIIRKQIILSALMPDNEFKAPVNHLSTWLVLITNLSNNRSPLLVNYN